MLHENSQGCSQCKEEYLVLVCLETKNLHVHLLCWDCVTLVFLTKVLIHVAISFRQVHLITIVDKESVF